VLENAPRTTNVGNRRTHFPCAAIEQDERSIAATEAGDYWTGAVFTVVDQLVPERATAK
jgi:hypothetical protein